MLAGWEDLFHCPDEKVIDVKANYSWRETFIRVMVMAGLRWPATISLWEHLSICFYTLPTNMHAQHYFRKLHQCEIGRIVAAGGFTGFIPEEARLAPAHFGTCNTLHPAHSSTCNTPSSTCYGTPRRTQLHVLRLFVYSPNPRIFPRSVSFSLAR